MLTVRDMVLFVSLFVFLIASAIGVIYSKHVSRQLFAELQKLQRERDDLHVEWTQLLLEQGTWASPARIEQMARAERHMTMPGPKQIEVIR